MKIKWEQMFRQFVEVATILGTHCSVERTSNYLWTAAVKNMRGGYEKSPRFEKIDEAKEWAEEIALKVIIGAYLACKNELRKQRLLNSVDLLHEAKKKNG